MNINDFKVNTWIEEGWKFRIKTVGGKRHTTRRKGKVERSLGPHDEEIWKRIIKLIDEKNRPPAVQLPLTAEEVDALKSMLATHCDAITELRGELQKLRSIPEATDLSKLAELKASQCPVIQEWYGQRFCSKYAWKWKPSEIIAMFPQVLFKRNKMGTEGSHWRFMPHPDICGFCNNFMELFYEGSDIYRKINSRFSSLESRFSSSESKIQSVEGSVDKLRDSARRRTRDDHIGCVHIMNDGYCTSWFYDQRRLDRDQKIDSYEGRTVYHDNVKKHPEICASCPSFEPRGVKKQR